MRVSRRAFSRMSALAGFSFLCPTSEESGEVKVPVAIVKTTDRKFGFLKAMELLGDLAFTNSPIYIKCNYGSPDPFPATTHPDALRAAIAIIREKGGHDIILVERSGMGQTREVLRKLRALDLIKQLDVSLLPLDELAAGEWRKMELPGSHWPNGIEVPSFLVQRPCIIQLCNLKTHRFGGQFSASLKNSVGLVAKYSGVDSHNYMSDLHSSKYQCGMIAEINQVYSPDLILMDAIQVFVRGGPESGELANPEVIAASRDRVALDSVGLALLRHYGAGYGWNRGPVLAQEQLKRAVELGLGIKSEKEIHFLTDDKASRSVADILLNIFNERNN